MNGLFGRCCKKKGKKVLDWHEKEELAKRRWRKVWLLRNLLTTVEEAKSKANDYGVSLYEGISIEAGKERVVHKKWIVYPWVYWKKIWDLIAAGLKMYYCFSIPYYLAFHSSYEGQLIPWDFFFDILLFIDIIVKLSTAFIKDSKLIDDRKSIFMKSIKELLIIDIICVLPLYAAYGELMWFRVLRLLQMSELKRALENANVIATVLAILSFNDYNSKQAFLRIGNFIMMLCVVSHNITCYLYLLAKDEEIGLVNTYLGNEDLDNEQIYAKTLYYVITTISTVGYGDISPKTSKEIAYVMFVQFLGVVIFAYLTGNITSILMNLNQREKMLSDKEISLDKWFLDFSTHHKFRIPQDMQKNIKDYFMYYWENDHSALLSETGFLMRMPLKLRNEFMEYLFSDEIEYFKVFFTDYEKQLSYSMMLNMYPRIFEEKNAVIKNATEVEEIYIIRRGKVILTTTMGTSFLVLGEKSFFGEEYVLFNDTPKILFYADSLGVECFCIKKGKYLELLNKYPKSFQAVLRRAFKRAKYFKAVMQHGVKKEEIGYEEGNLIKTKTARSGAGMYLSNFSWEYEQEENDELNELIMRNNEITAKEKILENLKSNQENMRSLQENMEKISQRVDEVKDFYEKDIQNLVQIINLLKEGHTLEANDLIVKLKSIPK
ncbi:hypothetical protein SteCoe_16931 [Stentor coeruleus]|uniref:Cyclic nucleotide-binding domain-containing protein n=1 Tax=Stentor coeruleus TaxID=5963 RepID=A0A1R2C069_9CILI|nr:hypothetical protein SteCoe_16931 [Stentor coeruleus]